MQASLSEPQDHRRDAAAGVPVLDVLATCHRTIGPADQPNHILIPTFGKEGRGPKAHELYLNPKAHKV